MTTSDQLPVRVAAVPDRFGKIRYRYRRKGVSAYIHETFPSAAFYTRYEELEAMAAKAASAATSAKAKPRSIDDLHRRYIASPKWLGNAATTRRIYGRILEKFCNRTSAKGLRYGERPVAAVTVAWLDNILGSMANRPGAAMNLRKILTRMFAYAVKLGWRSDNPAALTDSFKSGKGFHCWTDDEIAQYRAHYPYGTMARLTFELAFNTAARRCNLAAMEFTHIARGRITVEHAKGGNTTLVELLPETRQAIDAMPTRHIRYLIVGQNGKRFTTEGLGNRMRKWCDDAGLQGCSLHGIRKAISRTLVESGSTDAQGQAVTGHKKAETFVQYRATANRTQLASAAMSNLRNRANVQPADDGDN